MLDHHDGRLRHVDADLDHGGGDQELRLARGKARHGAVLVGALHAAVHQIDAVAEVLLEVGEALLGGGEIARFGFLDQRADPVDALAFVERAADRLDHLVEPAERDGAGVDRLAAGRLLAQFGNVHVAEIGQHQRARDRRRGHHQHVDRLALARQRQPLVHAEAVLLVDDGEREIAERDLLLEQRVGADQEIDLAEREPVERLAALAAALAAGEDGDPDAGLLGQRRDGGEMLAGEDFGRRHQRRLPPGLDHGRGGQQRHHGLAGADVALQQPHHALRPRQIGDDVVDGARLRRRQRIGQGRDHLARSRPSPELPRPGRRRWWARTSASASWPASNSS